MVNLTLKDRDIIECLDNSTANELLLDYNKNTFFTIIDKINDKNLLGALLEKIDNNENILSTDYINNKKVGSVTIKDNSIIKIELVKLNKVEADILEIKSTLDDVILAIGDLL